MFVLSDWIGLEGICLELTGLDWIGLDWIGLDWIGLDWIGLDWIGLECIGKQRESLSFTCIAMDPSGHGFVAGNGALIVPGVLYTTDSGASWHDSDLLYVDHHQQQ
jgi:hypothetical protein